MLNSHNQQIEPWCHAAWPGRADGAAMHTIKAVLLFKRIITYGHLFKLAPSQF